MYAAILWSTIIRAVYFISAILEGLECCRE
uniref:Uncharacterized protein n=1 Tax=Nelumbo nucifera TaxID=4432 RepID=A0A822Z0I2_NELNU|nr:TPA_asm: hypothetical protein HUJ06_009123 [Nelumbo nucifera]